MKKKWLALVLGALMVAATGCSQDQKADAPKEEKAVLRVATSPDFAPFEFLEGNQIVGFDVDLMNAIGGKMGKEIKFENSSWEGLIPALQAGNVDAVIAGVAITPERQEQVLFSDPYYQTGLGIFVSKDSGVKSLDDLKGKRIAVQMGTLGQDIAEEVEGADVRKLSVSADTFLELRNGTVDAVINHIPVFKYYLKTTGSQELIMVGEPMKSVPDGILVKKGNQALVDEINKALKEIKDSGEYDVIYEKWFGEKAPK
jgi:ABC-type amino acid transport/signal transduction systems, periplasmic component/domain